MTGFIAPVSIDEMSIFESEFHIKSDTVNGTLSVNLTLSETQAELEFDENSSVYSYRGGLIIDVCASQNDEPKMDAHVKVCGRLSVGSGVGDKEDARVYLRLNMVSMFYSHARSHIASLTSQSPMRTFQLVPIDPQAYIESVDSLDE